MSDMDEARHSRWLLLTAAWVLLITLFAVIYVLVFVFDLRTYKLTPLFLGMVLICGVLFRMLWVRAHPDKHPYAFGHSGVRSLAKLWPKGYWSLVAVLLLVAGGFEGISLLLELFTEGTLRGLLLLPFGVIGTYIVIMLIPQTRKYIISEIKEARAGLSRFFSWLSYFLKLFSRPKR